MTFSRLLNHLRWLWAGLAFVVSFNVTFAMGMLLWLADMPTQPFNIQLLGGLGLLFSLSLLVQTFGALRRAHKAAN